jgi:hypothetical protein
MSDVHDFQELYAAARQDPNRAARIDAFEAAMNEAIALADLRELKGATQRQVALDLGVSQANVSRIEHEEDLYLSTLRGYVAALGGTLELRAVFPDGAVTFTPRPAPAKRESRGS